MALPRKAERSVGVRDGVRDPSMSSIDGRSRGRIWGVLSVPVTGRSLRGRLSSFDTPFTSTEAPGLQAGGTSGGVRGPPPWAVRTRPGRRSSISISRHAVYDRDAISRKSAECGDFGAVRRSLETSGCVSGVGGSWDPPPVGTVRRNGCSKPRGGRCRRHRYLTPLSLIRASGAFRRWARRDPLAGGSHIESAAFAVTSVPGLHPISAVCKRINAI